MESRIYLGHTSALEALRAYSMSASQPAGSRMRQCAESLDLPECSTLRNLETSPSAALGLISSELEFNLNEPLHLLVSGKCKPRGTAKIVWHRSMLSYPAGSFVKLSDHVYSAAPELAFAQIGCNTPLVQLISAGYELCGNYADRCSQTSSAITTRRKLEAYMEKAPSIDGIKQARRAIKYVLDGSASPMETAVAMELTLPYALGGKNLPKPLLNKQMPLSKTASRIAGRRSLVFDLYWPDAKLAVEYDSQRFHSNNSARIKDSQKRAAAAKTGITLVSITEQQFRNILEFDEIAQMFARILGCTIRPRVADYRQRRLSLRAQLSHLHGQESSWP